MKSDRTAGCSTALARAGVANGQIEPYEYTDINQTVAGGLSPKGKQWGRPDDTFAIAGIVNGISGVHQAYLAWASWSVT